MAATTNPSLTTLLNKASLDDHAELLKASESALKSSKTDVQAQHVKVVSLLKLDKYPEAVAFIESCGNDLKKEAGLEYAYGLYKTGRLADAAKVAQSIEENRGAQHIEAQARYRLEDYPRTAELYKIIRKQDVHDEDFDLRVNQGAIDAQGQWLGLLDSKTVKKAGREDLEAFETAYNAACGSIARGELGQAEVLLKRAKELCRHSDDLTDDQKKEELLPITVQQIYVYHRQGKISEAESVAGEIKIEEIPDLSTRKVASNNRLLSSKDQINPFMAHKEFHNTPAIPESDQLFSYQSIPLSSNEKTVDLKSFKFTGLAHNTKKKLATQSSNSISSEALLLSAFNAAALARNETGKAAIKNVLPELERRPNDVGLITTLVQMYTLTGNTTTAIELMESLFKRLESSIAENEQDTRYHPGLISILVGLYRKQGRKSQIKQELAKSASYWRHKSKPPIALLRSAGISLLESSTESDIQTASEIFTKLYEQQPEEKATIAGYIASHAFSSTETIQPLSSKLTPIPKLIANINIDSLESQGVPQSTNALAIAQAQSNPSSRKRAAAAAAPTNSSDNNKPKRIRKSRLPKDYDPSSTTTKPDPERWLPLRDRSSYRPPKGKKKGGKKGGDDRTQGGLVSDELDVSKTSQVKGGEIVTAGNNTAGGGGGGGGKKKNKGKGKK